MENKLDINRLLDLDSLDEKRYEVMLPYLCLKVPNKYPIILLETFRYMSQKKSPPDNQKAPALGNLFDSPEWEST